MTDEAARIYQDWLDRSSALLMAGDTLGFCEHMHLPFRMRTAQTETVFETYGTLRDDLETVVAALRGQGATHFIRLTKRVRFLREDLIEGWYRTHILRGAQEVVPSYSSRMVLRRIDGVWKAAEADHELAGQRMPIAILRSQPGAFTTEWEQERPDIREDHRDAEPIYSAFLNALSDTVHSRDPAAWCSFFTDPHDVHYDESDHVVGPQGERAFFDKVLAKMDAVGADRFVRRADRAEFLSGDRIVGYHKTTMERAGTTVFGPIQSRMVLILREGRWLCTSVTNSLSDATFTEGTFGATDLIPTLRDIEKRTEKR